MQSMARSRDSPMDFAYDSSSRQRPLASSSWLNQDPSAQNATPRHGKGIHGYGHGMGVENGQVGSIDASLAPTIAGPDVEMTSDASPAQGRRQSDQHGKAKRNTELDSNDLYSDRDVTESRRIPSGGLTRATRQRGNGASTPKASHNVHAVGRRRRDGASYRSKSILADDEREDETYADDSINDDEDWLDDEVKQKQRGTMRKSNSLRRRVGDTLNFHYYNENPAHMRDRDLQWRGGDHRTSSPPSVQRWMEPDWCLGMVQFGFNATLLCGIVWVLFNVVLTLQRDVSSKVHEYEMEYLAEIEACSQSYHLNRCGTEGAVPALAAACSSWQRCSARDPANVGRARVAAETVAEIVNGFVDVVSWKSMLFTLLTLAIVVGATNSFLSFFRIRSRRRPDAHQRDSNRQNDSARHPIASSSHEKRNQHHGYETRSTTMPASISPSDRRYDADRMGYQ